MNCELCMACGVCVQSCPFSCLDLSKTDVDSLKKAYPELNEENECTGCGIYKKACIIDCMEIA